MSRRPPASPGKIRFAWMFFMQPVSLHQLLAEEGVEKPDTRGWNHFFARGPDRKPRLRYLGRMLFCLFVVAPLATAALAAVVDRLGHEVDWGRLLVGLACGVAFGLAYAMAGGVAFGVAFGAAFGAALGMALGVAEGAAGGAALGMADGSAFGVAGGVACGLALGVAYGVADGAAGGVILGLAGGVAYGVALGVAGGVILGVAGGVVLGVTGGLAVAVAYFRLLVWPAEALLQILLYWAQNLFKARTLPFVPTLWHNLSYLPLPYLGDHIEATAEQDLDLACRALDACAIAPGQRRIGRETLERLQGLELEQIASEGLFSAFVETDTFWLPPEEGADPVITQLRQIARLLVAAQGSSFAHHSLEQLRNAERTLDGTEVQLLQRSSRQVSAFRKAIPAWRDVILRRKASAEAEAAGLLPVPFRAGDPLDPQSGREVFRGRESSIREIEAHLALSSEARSVALLGPRRTGKSSLLRMLPVMLPDAICVFFDLQAHPVDSPGGFFRALAGAAREQARRSRQVDLPDLPAGPAFESAGAWIEALESSLGDRRLLICIDEFETLERSFGGSREDLLRLMGLLRATIQHRRKVRLLVAGEAPFDELDALWDSHFVSVREVRLGHLAPKVAEELVRHPIASFPEDAIPEPVARRLVERTGAQPFLVQLFAQILVSKLNEEKRKSAILADLDQVEEQALGQVGSYFRDLWTRAPPSAKEVLATLARGEKPQISKSTRRWLDRRCLIDAEGRLTIPVFGRFLAEEVLD